MWRKLNAKLVGHYQYYGINDNWPMLISYRERVLRFAKRHLDRRSQKSRLSWEKFHAYLERNPLASPRRLKDLIAMARSGSAVAK